MSVNNYLQNIVVSPDTIVALVHYAKAHTLYQQMMGLHEGFKRGSAEIGLATKIQASLELGASVPGDLLLAVYGAEVIEVATMQETIREVLDPRDGRTPFFTRIGSPTFRQNPPHFLHD